MKLAKRDYGIEVKTFAKPKDRDQFQLESEDEFIFKVKAKYIYKKNNNAACKL